MYLTFEFFFVYLWKKFFQISLLIETRSNFVFWQIHFRGRFLKNRVTVALIKHTQFHLKNCLPNEPYLKKIGLTQLGIFPCKIQIQ